MVRRWPQADPASPRLAAHAPAEAIERRPRLRARLHGRLDAGALTGLALTVAVALVVAGTLAFAVVLYMVRREVGLSRLDGRLATWASQQATDVSTTVLKLITELGGSRVLFPLTIVLAAVLYARQRRAAVIGFLALAVIGQNLLSNGIKLLVDRVRPDIDPLAGFSGPSFPSGHTTAAAACFAAFALVLGVSRSRRVQAALAAVAVAVAVAVGCTRVLLGVHWFTDVVGGLALGWSWFLLCSIAFGGRLLHFGAPVEAAERLTAVERAA
jgi:undecaprenyl-diphosphatase